jgi:hypothetical protein
MTEIGGGNVGHVRSLAAHGSDHKLAWSCCPDALETLHSPP